MPRRKTGIPEGAVVHCNSCKAYVFPRDFCYKCGAPLCAAATPATTPVETPAEPTLAAASDDPYKRSPKQPNKTEETVKRIMEKPGDTWLYEGLTLRINGETSKYTCDWFVMRTEGKPLVVECKSASRHHPSHNRAQLAFSAAKREYEGLFEFIWKEV